MSDIRLQHHEVGASRALPEGTHHRAPLPWWRSRRGWLIGAGAALAAVLAIAGVRASRAPATVAAGANAERDSPYLDGELIRFSPAFASRIGLTVVEGREKVLEPVVTVTGTVAFDTRRFAAVGARIAGRVHQLFKIEGDPVKPGAPLAELESAELGRAEAMLIGARAKEVAAQAEMKRERDLANAKVSAERDAETARASFAAAHAERVAVERTIQALGGNSRGALGKLILRSPIAGRVVKSNVARGQTVDPTATAFEIADLSTVWVVLRVFERDLYSVRKGDRVEINTQGGAARPLVGVVDHVGSVIAMDTRTAPLRVVVDNQEGLLRPGQSVQARIQIKGSAGSLLVVPRAAISRIDGKPTLLVIIGPGTVQPRAVELGAADGEDVAVVSGLKQGDKVVLGGLFALKSEIFR